MHEQLDMHSYQSYARLFIKEHKIRSQKINKRRATTIKIYSKMKKNMKNHKNNIKMFINTYILDVFLNQLCKLSLLF